MKNENNPRLILIIINLILIIICCFSKFITLSSTSTLTLDTYSIKAVPLVVFGFILLVYGLKTKNKIVTFISYIISIVGYIITFVTVKNFVNQVDGMININYEIGFYLYVLTAIILLISIFASIKEKDADQELYQTQELDKSSFLLCNMILGLKEIPFNSVVLLKKEDNFLSINYKSEDNILSKKIAIANIKKITFNPDLSINYNNNQFDDRQTANMLLSYSILGTNPLMAMAGNNILDSLTDEYEKGDLKTWFQITIVYEEDGIEEEIKVNTKKNPRQFISIIK